MSERTNLPLKIRWSTAAQADVRRIDRETAMRIFACIDRFRRTGSGDAKQLQPPLSGLRLRCADYRIFFRMRDDDEMWIGAVLHRSLAYRD